MNKYTAPPKGFSIQISPTNPLPEVRRRLCTLRSYGDDRFGVVKTKKDGNGGGSILRRKKEITRCLGFKLYERRNSLKNLKISPLNPFLAGSTRKQPEILSPSILDFPALVLSPVTPQDPGSPAAR
ncbi:VQ motif-containing protein 4 [Linum perenne]